MNDVGNRAQRVAEFKRLEDSRNRLADLSRPKGEKETLLRETRALESLLGVKAVPYNKSPQ